MFIDLSIAVFTFKFEFNKLVIVVKSHNPQTVIINDIRTFTLSHKPPAVMINDVLTYRVLMIVFNVELTSYYSKNHTILKLW